MDVSVCYLAYCNSKIGYGIKSLEHFLASYKKHNAGYEHELVILATNWTDKTLLKKVYRLADANNAKVLELSAEGLDLGTYIEACKLLGSEYVMFMATSTQIVAENWLMHLMKAFVDNKNLGLAGPMGSWGRLLKSQNFPNPHIRTCTFLTKRELYLEYASTIKFPQTKEDTYEMEHGTNSLSNFILNKGLELEVVNNDGKTFKPEAWPYSFTYKNRICKKYLLSDKHVLEYENLHLNIQRVEEIASWGQNIAQGKIKIFAWYKNITPAFISDIYQNIYVGSAKAPNMVNAIKDNIGENISERSKIYGKLTTYYWALKNYIDYFDFEYFGFCKYNAFLDFEIHNDVNTGFKPLFITDFEQYFKDYTDKSIYEKIKDFDVVTSPKEKNEFNINSKIIAELEQIVGANILKNELNMDEIYSDIVFVMKTDLLKEYLTWLFDVLFKLENRLHESDINENAFENLSNILFNVWLNSKKGLIIKETTSVSIPMDGM